MGIHSGPVNEVTDLNEQANIAGAGINIAQRVMDCGDAGHILLSRHVADDLKHYARWRSYLHEIGECKVKHGEIISLVNFYTEELGNPQRPQNIRGAAPAKSVAVLPFVNMSADKNDEYLSDGMTEELINALAKVPGLRVPGRTSCFAFKGKTEEDIFRKVSDQLHVRSGSPTAPSPLYKKCSRYRTKVRWAAGSVRLLLRCSGSIQCSIRCAMIRAFKDSPPRPRQNRPVEAAGSAAVIGFGRHTCRYNHPSPLSPSLQRAIVDLIF